MNSHNFTITGALLFRSKFCLILDFVHFQVWERDSSTWTMWLEVLHEFRPESGSQPSDLHTAGEGTVSSPCTSHHSCGGTFSAWTMQHMRFLLLQHRYILYYPWLHQNDGFCGCSPPCGWWLRTQPLVAMVSCVCLAAVWCGTRDSTHTTGR